MELVVDQPGLAVRRLAQSGFPGAALFGTKIHLLSRNPGQEEVRIREALSTGGVRVRSISQRPLSLEDVFVHRVMALEQHEGETATGVAA